MAAACPGRPAPRRRGSAAAWGCLLLLLPCLTLVGPAAADPVQHPAWQHAPFPPEPEQPWLDRSQQPASHSGRLLVSIRTVHQATPKAISKAALRCEVWLAGELLAAVAAGDPGARDTRDGRLFTFPPLELPVGYHHVEIRLVARGGFSNDEKHKRRVIQVGIHPGQVTVLERTVPFFVW